MSNLFDLAGKTAIVTGSSRGLGQAICVALAEHGANVVGVSQSNSEEILSRIPAGRWGTPEDLMGAVVFLSSSASDYVNGHILAVDGGWLAR